MIINACSRLNTINFDNTKTQLEMGYVAHLFRLAKLVDQVCSKNEDIKAGIESEFPDWAEFQSTVLGPRLEVREGELCRSEEKKKEKAIELGGFDDDDDEPERPLSLQFNRPDDYGGDIEE